MVSIVAPSAMETGVTQDAPRHAVQHHRAGPALRDAAAELGPRKAQFVAQDPEQWRVVRNVHAHVLSVDS